MASAWSGVGRALGGRGCFLKFRVPGISDAVKSDKSPDLPNTNSSREKLGFRVFGNLGEEWSSYWNVAYRWLTDLKWNVSKWQCLPFCPPLEHASEQLPCRLWGWRPQAAILASCCSSFEMRSS